MSADGQVGSRSTDETADAIFGSIERGDMARLTELWADDIEVWHSNDEVVKNKQQSLAVLAWMFENTASVSYEGIVRDVTSAGFVQRHILQVTHHDGETAGLSVAIFVSVRNGRVVRIDEYFDADRARAVLRI